MNCVLLLLLLLNIVIVVDNLLRVVRAPYDYYDGDNMESPFSLFILRFVYSSHTTLARFNNR